MRYGDESSRRAGRWLRFILGGVVNTVFTYGVYLSLNQLLSYQLAYFIAFATGVVFSYWFNAVIVFRLQLTWKGLFSYPLTYVVQYGVSAVLLGTLIEGLGVSEWLAPLVVTIGMVPMTYVLSKALLNWSVRPRASKCEGGVDEER